MKNIAYYNGKTAPIEEMMVPMNDRACYFGDGVYDATCVVNHVPMAFDDHIDRIYRSAKLIDIDIPMEKAEMKRMLQELVDQVEGDTLFLYWQVTRGVGMRNHPYSGAGDKPSIWAFVRPSKMRDPFGVYKCITVEDKRFFYCNIKTINLLPAVMANEKAMEAGCDEAIFHRGDRVTECSHSNVHILKNGTLYTAPCDELILPGITRARSAQMPFKTDSSSHSCRSGWRRLSGSIYQRAVSWFVRRRACRVAARAERFPEQH